MRILHAADLHLGKSLHERSLVPDQEHLLKGILAAIRDRKPAALLLAGDLYDRAIPQPEAISLFDSFLSEAAGIDPELVIVAIPGNHDSAARLSFGASLLSRGGIHLRTRVAEAGKPIMVERGGERMAVFALPFLAAGSEAASMPGGASEGGRGGGEAGKGGGEAAPGGAADRPSPRAAPQVELPFESAAELTELAGTASDAAPRSPATRGEGEAMPPSASPSAVPVFRSQAELFEAAVERISRNLVPGAYNVLLAHCFARGGTSSESERAFLGLAELVPASLFDRFDYAALGHLHRHQAAGARGRYPGAPMAYSFSEGGEERGVLLVEFGPEGLREEFLPIKPLRRLRRVEGRFAELASPGAFPDYRGDYIEARLLDEEAVFDPVDFLRGNFPHLLSVRQAAFELAAAGGVSVAASAGEGPGGADPGGEAAVLADFDAFWKEMKGEEADPAIRELFTEIAALAGSAEARDATA
jgi:exonuclease SbcD